MVLHYFPSEKHFHIFGNKIHSVLCLCVCVCAFLLFFFFSWIVVVTFRWIFSKRKTDEQPLFPHIPMYAHVSFFLSLFMNFFDVLYTRLVSVCMRVCECVCVFFHFLYSLFDVQILSSPWFIVCHFIHFKLLLQIDKHLIIVHLFPLINMLVLFPFVLTYFCTRLVSLISFVLSLVCFLHFVYSRLHLNLLQINYFTVLIFHTISIYFE